jgi:serine protease Do
MKSTANIPAMLIMCLLSVLPETALSQAQPDISAAARRIIDNFGGNIYTVNAFTEIGAAGSGNKEQPRWRQNVGTAFLFDSHGYLITFNNVVKDARSITIVPSTGEQIKAHVLGCDKSGKISVLQTDGVSVISSAQILHCKNVSEGDNVILVGLNGSELTTAAGTIEDVRSQNGTLIVSVESTPGTTGTPVFDLHGHLLGFLVYQLESDESSPARSADSYVVASSQFACTAAKLIISRAGGTAGWLGITSSIDTFNTSNQSGRIGVLIQNIVRNSPADKSGLRINDVITRFNDVDVASFAELIELITVTSAGMTVPVQILRGGKQMNVDITLSDIPDGM